MILGLSASLFTQIHVAISLVGIAAGIAAIAAAASGRHTPGWTALFLATTALTVATGFAFPTGSLTPAQIFGIIATPVLLLAAFALYGRHLAGPWRRAYVVAAVLALYLNSFVLIVQAFQKLPPLQALAPTQSETPFLVAQIALLLLALVAGTQAWRRYHPTLN